MASGCRSGSSAISSKARIPAGASSRRCCCRCAIPGERFVERHENEWPLARTQWTKFYLHPADMTMSTQRRRSASSVTYAGFSDGVTFLTEPLEEDVEITGPIAAKLWVSSATEDADLFLVVRAFTPRPEGSDLPGRARFPYADRARLAALLAPQARLRSSRCPTGRITPTTRSRSSSPARSTRSTSRSGRPASCCRKAIGWRCRCAAPTTSIPASRATGLETLGKVWTGVGPFTHNDPRDRPPAVFGGDVTLHAGPIVPRTCCCRYSEECERARHC